MYFGFVLVFALAITCLFGKIHSYFAYIDQPFIGISDFTVPAQHSVIPDISKTTDPAPCHH